jgi:hypothetical protein
MATQPYRILYYDLNFQGAEQDGESKQKLWQIFSYGFGDLNYTDDRIGQTPLSDYREVATYLPTQNGTSWLFTNLIPADSISSSGNPNISWASNNAMSNVDTIEGAALYSTSTNNSNIGNNWIERSGPRDSVRLEVDISGRLFTNGVNGFDFAYVTVDVEYKLKTSGVWLPITAVAGYTVANNDSNPFIFTFSANVPSGQYDVRARFRTTNHDNYDANVIREVSLSVARFFQTDSGNYAAINRRSLEITATDQISGAIKKFSSLVSAKCWVYSGPAIWDGTYPETNTGSWAWTNSENPADWFLYFSRGGFLNTSWNAVSATQPTLGWANGVYSGNTDRLFGVGLENSRIDYQKIISWQRFCATQTLTFGATVDTEKSCAQILTDIAQVGRGATTWASGKLGVVWEQASDYAAPVAIFSPANILKDSFSISYASQKLPDEVIANFTNPDIDWQQDTVRSKRPDTTNPQNQLNIDLWGVKNKSQATREANILACRQLFNRRTVTFDVAAEGMFVNRGDVVLVSHNLVNWGFSGRASEFIIESGLVKKIKIDESVPSTITSLRIRRPDGIFSDQTCVVAGEYLEITSAMPETIAPSSLNNLGTLNPSSLFSDSLPEDFIWLADQGSTFGKPMRITDIKPKGMSYTLTLRDEEPAIYAFEYNNLPTALTVSTTNDYSKIVSKVINSNVEMLGAGKVRVSWSTEQAVGVIITATVNGAGSSIVTSNGGGSHLGNFIELQYSVGDFVTMTLAPYFVGTAYQQISDTLNFTVRNE